MSEAARKAAAQSRRLATGHPAEYAAVVFSRQIVEGLVYFMAEKDLN